MVRTILVPRHIALRITTHSMGTAAGIVTVVHYGSSAWWFWPMWYAAGFALLHAAMVPFVVGWVMVAERLERWVRGIVEEELIRFDLGGYQRQLRRFLPDRHAPDRNDE